MRRMLGHPGDVGGRGHGRRRRHDATPSRRCPGSTASASSSSRSAPPACRSSCRSTASLDPRRRHRAVRLPDRPGGADQRPQARPRRPRPVRLAYGPRALEIEVTDRGGSGGRGIGVPGAGGRGLIGMRERVAVFGGRFEAGPASGGFRVSASLPAGPVIATPSARRLTMPIRVLLVDDQQLVRTGFRMILDDERDIEVVGEAPTARSRSSRCAPPTGRGRDGHPDAGHGRGGGHPPHRRGPATTARVLVLTTFDADETVVQALKAGASGFLLKDVPPAGFVEAIRIVAAGDALLAPSVTRQLLDRFRDRLPGPVDPAPGPLPRADRTRARGRQARRPWPVEPRDRRAPCPRRADGQDPRLARSAEARPA